MRRKINKKMAGEAAVRFSEAMFGKKIELVKNAMQDLTDEFIMKYIPRRIISVTSEYRHHFFLRRVIMLTAIDESQGYKRRMKDIRAISGILVPDRCVRFTLTIDEYNRMKQLEADLDSLVKQQEKLCEDIKAALIDLATDVRVAQILPEVLPFIEFPPVKDFPVNCYDELHERIKVLGR